MVYEVYIVIRWYAVVFFLNCSDFSLSTSDFEYCIKYTVFSRKVQILPLLFDYVLSEVVFPELPMATSLTVVYCDKSFILKEYFPPPVWHAIFRQFMKGP